MSNSKQIKKDLDDLKLESKAHEKKLSKDLVEVKNVLQKEKLENNKLASEKIKLENDLRNLMKALNKKNA